MAIALAVERLSVLANISTKRYKPTRGGRLFEIAIARSATFAENRTVAKEYQKCQADS